MKFEIHGDTSFITEDFLKKPTWKIERKIIKSLSGYDSTISYEVFYSDDPNIKFTEPKQHEKDSIYMEMAQVWSKNSKCKRMQVGSLIVKDKSIISDGYNGSPSGFPNICEVNDVTLPYVLHAEANAITKLARGTQSSDGSTLYVTLSPCYECSKLIIQSGIRRVVFSEIYRKPESIAFLAEAGIEILRKKQ
jgi:dCMP deaminase